MIQTSFFEEEKEEIFIDPNGLKPVKLEIIVTDKNIPEDTYVIYPSGGFHLFYGVPNTFPIYQEKIWPHIKRIKYATQEKIRVLKCDLMGSINYPRINFSPPTGRKNEGWDAKMHRLVALAFVPNPENYPFVMHRNDDQTNFLVTNLLWGTPKMNNTGKSAKRPDTMEDKYKNMLLQGIIKG
jgi:hypothetical protein